MGSAMKGQDEAAMESGVAGSTQVELAAAADAGVGQPGMKVAVLEHACSHWQEMMDLLVAAASAKA